MKDFIFGIGVLTILGLLFVLLFMIIHFATECFKFYTRFLSSDWRVLEELKREIEEKITKQKEWNDEI